MKNSYPLFIVTDINQTADCLKEKFGYEAVFESDWYIQLAHGEQQLGIMIENSENQPSFLHKPFSGAGAILTIEVADVDKIYPKFAKKEILHELVTEEWGQRHFIIQVPGKLIIDVVNYTQPEDYS